MTSLSIYPTKFKYRGDIVSVKTCVVMKVGSHGDEGFKEIIKRKEKEERLSGFMLWGYSGNLLDAYDTRIFLKSKWPHEKRLFILMSETKSPFKNNPVRSKAFSVDKYNWYKLPNNVYTYGCDKAIVCKGLERINTKINLAAYRVSVGPSKGQNLSNYMKYRTDKAGAEYFPWPREMDPLYIDINWIAEIVPPFSIYLSANSPIQTSLISEEINSPELGVLAPFLY